MRIDTTTTACTAAQPGTVPLVLPPGPQIRMVAFERQDKARARDFVCLMTEYANQRVKGIAHKSIVPGRDEFIEAPQAKTRVLLVSAHGPCTPLAKPVIGDGIKANRIYPHHLGRNEPFVLGARAGAIWDICFSGQETFTSELARLSAPDVVHVAPVGMIVWENSEALVKAFLDALLHAGSCPVITYSSVADAAAAAVPSAGIDMSHGTFTAADPS